MSHKLAVAIFCAGLALLAGGVFLASTFDPDRCLARSWEGFIGSIEARDGASTAGYLAGDYSDAWGYTQQTLSADLRRMMMSFSHLKLALSDVTITRTEARAMITAKVRMSAGGRGNVTDATRQINALTEPFVLHWERDGLLPWRWRMIRVEQSQFDAHRYSTGSSVPMSWPF